jgi:DNA polymerase III subunit alpha
MSSFFNCHSHSEYSPLDGISYVEDIVKRAKELNYCAVALTDHGEVGGHLELEKYAKQYGIKPIYGIETYMCEDRFDKDKTKKRGESTGHMVILAMNDKGLENLWALSSLAYLEGKYYDPRIDWQLLEKYNEGLIVTGACMGGWIGKDILTNPMQALTNAAKLQAIFGDRFYLELHTYQDPTQEEWNKASVILARRLSIPLIVVNDSHYTNPEDWYLHECLTAVQMGKTMNDKTRFQYGENQLGMLSEADSRQRLNYLPKDVVEEAIQNTGRIADMCNASIPRQHGMPLFYNDKEMDADILRRNIEVGFNLRIKPHISADEVDTYWQRILYETEVIIDHGFQGYFLIVQDIISWSKTNDILIGPGRGSVNGSAVAWSLGITEIDPIKHGLYFERFLDMGRVSLPDIDIDVPKDQRHLVKEYLETKYGKNSVASIGLFNTMAHKQAIKDLCRGLDIPIADANQISKVISGINIDGVLLKDLEWEQVLNHYADDFALWVAKYPKLFELLPKTVGHIRHHGVHAGGMVVNKDSLIGKLPLRFKTDKGDEETSTQFDMHGVEDLGFVKIDLLGLRTLSTLTETMRLIKERHGDVLDDFYDWSNNWEKYYEDQRVWDDISSGNNLGVFQLETFNLSNLSKRFKPQSIDDLAALLSVCRPGISRTIDEKTGLNYLELYIQKRDKKVPVTYKHPKLKEILGGTLGTLVYQEQAMKIAVEIAGYSLQEADKLRKIIGKSQSDKMKEERETFVTKSVENGTKAELANSIFDEMEKFGQYAFNLSHALGYSLITYWSAYLKTHYPHEFMTALFRTNPDMAPAYTKEARRLGISVLGPDINESGEKFTLTNSNSIRYGLESIKFISGTTANLIEQLQPFSSMSEFIDKIDKSKIRINKSAVYSMISVGAFDSLTINTVNALEEYLRAKHGWIETDYDTPHITRIGCELCHGSLSKFNCLKVELNLNNRAANELANLGSLVSINPLQGYTDLIRKETTFAGEDYMITGEKVIVGGLLSQIKPLMTKKGKNPGQKMAQIVLDLPEDDSLFIEETDEEGEVTDVNSLQIVVFPSVYKMVEDKLEQGTPVLMKVEKLSSGLSLQNIWRLDLLKNSS